MWRARIGLAALLACAGACVSSGDLRARPAPVRHLPAVARALEPAAPGRGRVAVDSDDGPTRVVLVERPRGQRWRATHLCLTPCVAELPVGPHEIAFVPPDDELPIEGTIVVFGALPSVLLRTAPREHDDVLLRILGIGGVAWGVIGQVVGTIGLGVAASAGGADGPSYAGQQLVCLAWAAGGIVAMIAGFAALRAATQVRTGRNRFWTPGTDGTAALTGR